MALKNIISKNKTKKQIILILDWQQDSIGFKPWEYEPYIASMAVARALVYLGSREVTGKAPVFAFNSHIQQWFLSCLWGMLACSDASGWSQYLGGCASTQHAYCNQFTHLFRLVQIRGKSFWRLVHWPALCRNTQPKGVSSICAKQNGQFLPPGEQLGLKVDGLRPEIKAWAGPL